MKVEDVAKELEISIFHSYKIMQQLKKELKAKEYLLEYPVHQSDQIKKWKNLKKLEKSG